MKWTTKRNKRYRIWRLLRDIWLALPSNCQYTNTHRTFAPDSLNVVRRWNVRFGRFNTKIKYQHSFCYQNIRNQISRQTEQTEPPHSNLFIFVCYFISLIKITFISKHNRILYKSVWVEQPTIWYIEVSGCAFLFVSNHFLFESSKYYGFLLFFISHQFVHHFWNFLFLYKRFCLIFLAI